MENMKQSFPVMSINSDTFVDLELQLSRNVKFGIILTCGMHALFGFAYLFASSAPKVLWLRSCKTKA